jgi:hypothetical protein
VIGVIIHPFYCTSAKVLPCFNEKALLAEGLPIYESEPGIEAISASVPSIAFCGVAKQGRQMPPGVPRILVLHFRPVQFEDLDSIDTFLDAGMRVKPMSYGGLTKL